MTEQSARIVFMGTPEFAVSSLDAIIKAGSDVVAVVTVPDKPAGRGRKLSFSPVKEYALRHNLHLLQPVRLKEETFISELERLNADIFVVVAFRMLPAQVWSIPRLGTFNAHASLLPQYRGAAPINHAIINGESRSGVTTFLLDKEIDTGKILLRQETPIGPDETAGELHDRLMTIAAQLAVNTINGLMENSIAPVLQKECTEESYTLNSAPKIFPDDTVIRWNSDAGIVHNFIRGLSPYPGARTTIISGSEKLTLKILGSSMTDQIMIPGEIKVTPSGLLLIGCKKGSIVVTSVQAEGRKRMPSADFLRGFDISGWKIVS